LAESSTNRLSASVAARAVDAHLAQSLVAGGIGGHRQQARKHGALGAFRAGIHHHEGRARMAQFLSGAAPHAPVAADDEVIFQLLDHAFAPPPVENIAEFQFDDGLGHGPDGDENGGNAEENEERVEHPPGMRQRMDLAIAHSRHGD